MATNSKNVQKRADDKRRGKRSRNWQGILYPESVPDWAERIEQSGVDMVVSPLHDKDFDRETGELVKPHYHLLLLGSTQMSRDNAADIMEAIGAVVQRHSPAPDVVDRFKVVDKNHAARYLCHLDEKDKHRYDPDDVTVFGDIDYRLLAKCDEYSELKKKGLVPIFLDICEAMKKNDCFSFSQVLDWVVKFRPEWVGVVMKDLRGNIIDYGKSLYFLSKNNISYDIY